MNDIIMQNLFTVLLGGGLMSTVTGVITLKYTKKQAEAKALSSMQDVYQELITDLRNYNNELKKDKEESDRKQSERILKLENKIADHEQKITGNEREIEDLKRFKCTNLSCNNRKQ